MKCLITIMCNEMFNYTCMEGNVQFQLFVVKCSIQLYVMKYSIIVTCNEIFHYSYF